MRHLLNVILIFVSVSMMCVSNGCKKEQSETVSACDTIQEEFHKLPDTLRVATLYGPLSYFYFRDDTMGYDYSLAKEFAEAKGMILDITVTPSLESAIELLDSMKIDMIAYEVPETKEYKKLVYNCGPEFFNAQVLLQNTKGNDSIIKDVTQLVGREVWVEKNSKYHHRIENLNEELGGGIDIRIIDRDTITNEEIIEMVSKKEIPLSIIDSDIGKLNKKYYPEIDINVEVSFAQRSTWAVSNSMKWLGDTLTAWFNAEGTQRENEILLKRYFELSKAEPTVNIDALLKEGRVSPYDEIFKRHSARIGWDWRLLAAISYAESRFNNDVVSWAGARGIMQVMPSTARGHGVSPDSLVNPEISIKLAADILAATEKSLRKHVTNTSELKMMSVAAYNSGVAHILDAITLARKYGKDPNVWYDNVETGLTMKSDEKYFKDPDVKYGYFGGRQTIRYVKNVFDYYENIKKHISK